MQNVLHEGRELGEQRGADQPEPGDAKDAQKNLPIGPAIDAKRN
jgi:hypothetical protein